jgi:hypothetical protein
MKMCVELGMHRRRKLPRGVTQYQEEIRKRTFWTVYGLDRWFALTLGRPLGIDDGDIDQAVSLGSPLSLICQLPWNVECDIDIPDSVLSPQSAKSYPDSPMTVDNDGPLDGQFTSMSSAIHGIRLRRIEAQIQRTAYSLHSEPEKSREATMSLLNKLDRWKETRPRRPPGAESTPCCSDDWFLMKSEAVSRLHELSSH